MSVRLQAAMRDHQSALRHEPIGVRIRAYLGDDVIVDTTHAVLVWEPRRVTPVYAVPVDELRGHVSETASAGTTPAAPENGPVSPSVPFAAHTAPGRSYDLTVGEHTVPHAAFAPDDPDLDGLVLLDFGAFDRWLQEDEPNIGGPRDPFHRIDSFPSSRRVRVRHGGTVVAESTRPVVVFENGLPPRFYLPREDVRVELTPTETSTICPYKGVASYWSVGTDDGDALPDAVWAYLRPMPDVALLEGHLCFDDSALDVTVEPG